MTLDRWIMLVVGLIGAINLIGMRLIALGRWTQKTETDLAAKPRVTLERLGWDIEAIGKDIKDLRAVFDGRYAELAGKVTADHQELRDIKNWRAGLLTELGKHFHPVGIVDRMILEGEKDRDGLRTRVAALEAIFDRRRDVAP